ncbi:DNA repair protein RecN [Reichenbachiella sp. MALMAid0571]|uniref:DNA repair protein RecN n=1 Tax=Reichenbachiella sp. MALMAid0571 TaxID=3143939 RepID=UPI0032E0161C
MLTKLSIQNYALIRELEIAPSSGLNIITGETGAGKSIVLGAVGLLLGNRADTKALLLKEKKCIIEGEFNIGNYALEEVFEEADLDYEELTIVRREINLNGKSRAFINDVPTTLDVLKQVGLKLLDIHSQNESIEIVKKDARLKIIDDYAQTSALIAVYKKAHSEFKVSEKRLNDLLTQQANLSKEEDYNNFLLDELVKASFQADEQETLESELKVLDNSEDIKLKLSQVVGEFKENEYSISDKLAEMNQLLRSTASFSDKLENLNERFASSLTELKDIVDELSDVLESVEHNPQRIEEINLRLGLLYQLQQKHQVLDIEGLLKIQNDLESKVMATQNLEEELAQEQQAFEKRQKAMLEAAEKLSGKRTAVLDKFSDDINQLLSYVGIPDGRLEMTHKETDPTNTGTDEVEMLFSANKGIAPQPVGQVASGGEFSRLMLCIKYLLATKTSMPTIIFDEIDTGVSGEIAKKMAVMMKRMSEKHQVIAISHLPQIAAKGDAHYFVYKNQNTDTTESFMRKLDANDHVLEVAKMIGGDNPSEAALKNAKELIEG